jgi:glycosyltransferase involved in cell wall biosynthesis
MKKILLVSDVKGWGGWVRGEYIKKHLSDEFHFNLVDENEFKRIECLTNPNIFTDYDFHNFKNNKSNDKDFFDINLFMDYFRSKKKENSYDLYYFLFHTMMIKKSVKRLVRQGKNIVTIVTGFPTVKPCFKNDNGTISDEQKFRNHVKKCKAIFANNIKSLDDLNQVKPNHVPSYYCPRGVDENVFFPMDLPKKKFTVAYVGKPVPEKGLEQFIKPACQIIGANLIINDRNFTNALSPNEMREFYNQADVYVVASIIDGTPNPALEAAACGVPIISNAIGNMPEFIRHGVNGFLIQERDIDKYANLIGKLMNNKEKRIQMGKEARKTVLKEWTWEKVLENERRAFREILNG